MIACFENLIGIRTTCGEQVPSDSDLYIQDLSFMNMKLADALVTDQDSGKELLEALYSNAVNYLVNDARTRMMPYFKMGSILEDNIAGYYPLQTAQISSSAGNYKGIQMQVRQWPYLDVFISSLTLYVNYTGTISLEVWNLTTGKLIDTIEVETTAGEQTSVDVYKNYPSNGQTLNMFVGYNTTGIDCYQASVYNSVIPNSFGNCRSCLSTPYRRFGNKYVWLYSQSIPAASAKVQTSLRYCNDTGGLSLTYSLNCSLDKWLCTMKKSYAFGLLHRWGMEVLREAQMSTRLNTLITLKKEEKENLYSYFEQEYKKAMDNSFRNIRLPNDVCFKCNSHINVGITMP